MVGRRGQLNYKALAHRFAYGFYCELFTCSDKWHWIVQLLSLILHYQVRAASKLVLSSLSSNLTFTQ